MASNSGENMTLGFNISKFDQFEGGLIGAFYDLNRDGVLQCVGLESSQTPKINMGDEPISNTIWGINGSYKTWIGKMDMMMIGL